MIPAVITDTHTFAAFSCSVGPLRPRPLAAGAVVRVWSGRHHVQCQWTVKAAGWESFWRSTEPDHMLSHDGLTPEFVQPGPPETRLTHGAGG